MTSMEVTAPIQSTDSPHLDQSTPPTVEQQYTGKAMTTRPWKVSSPKYHEFVAICVKNKWHHDNYLPVRGSQRGAELDKFMLEGMPDTEGNPKPFTRTQVNAKFAHWKASLNVEEESGKAAFVRNMVVSDWKSLFARVERKSQLFTTGVVYRKIVWYSNSANYPTHYEILMCESCAILFEKLRFDIIASVNESLEVKNVDKAVRDKIAGKTHDATEFQLIQQFGASYGECAKKLVLAQSNTDTNITTVDWSRVEALGRNVAREFSRQINIDIKLGQDTETLSSRINVILATIQDNSEDLFPEDDLYNETIYSVAGWLLCASRKAASRRTRCSCLAKWLPILVERSDVRGDEKQRESLPTAKVEWSQLYENRLHFASRNFFSFVAAVEKVCRSIFLEELAKIYGPSIVADTANVLKDHDVLKDCLDSCFDNTPGEECLAKLSTFLVTTFMHMRGKDYVRIIMGDSRKASLTMGIRQLLEANRRATTSKRPPRSVLCYFCGVSGHASIVCPEAERPPPDGAPDHKVTNFHVEKKDVTRTWNWCTKCKRWQGHSTGQHQEKKEVQGAFADLRQTVLDDCMEMHEAIDECLDECLLDEMMDAD